VIWRLLIVDFCCYVHYLAKLLAALLCKNKKYVHCAHMWKTLLQPLNA
jgi:hypothetical protein